MIEEILAEAGEKMEKTIEATKTEFAKVRTGRVNPAIFSRRLLRCTDPAAAAGVLQR